MRKTAGQMPPNDFFALGWITGYLMKAALEQAIESDDLTPNETAVRTSFLNKVDKSSSTGVSAIGEAFEGPTLQGYEFTERCFLMK